MLNDVSSSDFFIKKLYRELLLTEILVLNTNFMIYQSLNSLELTNSYKIEAYKHF